MNDLHILFWNMYGKDLSENLAAILDEHRPNIVLLCEFGGSERKLLETVNRNETRYRLDKKLGDGRLVALTTESHRGLKRVRDEERYSFWRVGNGPRRITLCGLHLPSRLYLDQKELNQLLPRISTDIAAIEEKEGHDRTILIGDLNLNPFDEMIMSSEGLHAISSLKEASKGSRQVQKQERKFFYNPMWSLLGDRPLEPAGTYFWRSGVSGYGWNMLDQSLFRPTVMERFADFEVEILTRAGDNPLTDDQGRPDSRTASDHLPIRIRFIEGT